jgi:cellulose synthase (UDP-forming)
MMTDHSSHAPHWPAPLRWFLPNDALRWSDLRRNLLRVLIAANLVLGTYYMLWRYEASINWQAWWFALALLLAETYSYIDAWLFGLTMWKVRQRGKPPSPPPPPPDPHRVTVDVFITCYNEPVDLVRETVRAAMNIRYPHNTYVLDDGDSADMRAMAEEEGAGYIVRSPEWRETNREGKVFRQRHAKAGNLINALDQTSGEFLLILDADQIPYPYILHHTLGYFRDEQVALVQTPQWFYNDVAVSDGDPFGSNAPLFYGNVPQMQMNNFSPIEQGTPWEQAHSTWLQGYDDWFWVKKDWCTIQQGKDGWNAAFFCGSNAVLRREALMHLGVSRYARELEERVRRALRTANSLLRRAERQIPSNENDQEYIRTALRELRRIARKARQQLRAGYPIQDVTWSFQREARIVCSYVTTSDLARIEQDLAAIPGIEESINLLDSLVQATDDDEKAEMVRFTDLSPLQTIEAVRYLIQHVDVSRPDEAFAVMPLATISVTEDMATAMRLHSLGWKSVFHDDVLAIGLAPEDLRSALQQRLRWAQGTLQVMFRENPLVPSRVRGLSVGQRLMYFATMWSYLSGFASVVYLLAPVIYLLFGVLPVRALDADFFWHLLPFLLINQVLFTVVGWGNNTWRGQQYNLALFPLWIKAVTSTIGNVFFGKKLGFVVTPKTRQRGVHFGLVRVQLGMMALLVFAILVGLGKLALGISDEGVPILVNVFWACYDLLMLSVVLDAATYQPSAGE